NYLNRTVTEVIPDGVIDPDGTRHQISCTGWTSIPSSNSSYCSQFETSDGSLTKITRSGGYSLQTYIDYGIYDNAMFTAYYPNGMQKNFTKPFGSGTSRRHYPYLIEDSNGNRIRANYRTEQSGSISQIFDTLNREIKFYYEPGTGGDRERL